MFPYANCASILAQHMAAHDWQRYVGQHVGEFDGAAIASSGIGEPLLLEWPLGTIGSHIWLASEFVCC